MAFTVNGSVKTRNHEISGNQNIILCIDIGLYTVTDSDRK